MGRGRPPTPHASFWRSDAGPVVRAAASAWRLSYETLIGPSRAWPIPEARFAAMLVLKRQGWSYPTIAMGLGRADHTTAMHGVKRAVALESSDPGFAAAVAAVAHATQRQAPASDPLRQ